MTTKNIRTASVSSIADAKSKNPPNIRLTINGQSVDPQSLDGLGLATLESLLSDVDAHLSAQQAQQRAFTSGLREVIKARAKGGSTTITIDVTSALDAKTKTLTHSIKVR